MIQTLVRAFLVLVVVNAWFLLGIVVCDYLFGNLLGLFTTSIYSQAWAILLLVALSFSPPLKATQLNIKQWCSTTGVGIYLLDLWVDTRLLRHEFCTLCISISICWPMWFSVSVRHC